MNQSQPGDAPELAPDSGEQSEQDILDRLTPQDPSEPPAPPEADEEDVDTDQPPGEAGDDDPEIDLGDLRLKRSELRAGYMKDADYRQKTAQAAEVRRAAEAMQQQVQQERAYHANQLDVLIGGLQTQLVGDQHRLAQLAQDDPAAWVAENAKFQQRYAQYQQAVQHRQALAQRSTAEQEAAHAQWRQAEREALQSKLPEWRDSKVAQAEQQQIAGYLLDIGYPASELEELFDHRALLVARDAAKWQAHQRALKAAKAKQAPTPPRTPVRPGAAPANPQSARDGKYAEALARAKRTSNAEDVMRVLMLKGKR